MRKLGFIFLIALLSGCASSKITAVVNEPTARPYAKFAVILTENDHDFYQLDPASYDKNIQPSFNKLDLIVFRDQLLKTFERNLGSEATQVIKSSELYPVNIPVSFTDFTGKINESGAEAILLINLKAYWEPNNFELYSRRESTDTSPSALFNCYLIDVKSGKPVWIARSQVTGSFPSGYDTINNTLAKSVAKKLLAEGYIYR